MECSIPVFLLAWDVHKGCHSPTGLQSFSRTRDIIFSITCHWTLHKGWASCLSSLVPSPQRGAALMAPPTSPPPPYPWNPAPLTQRENAIDVWWGLVTETQSAAYQGTSGKIPASPHIHTSFSFRSLMSSRENICLQLRLQEAKAHRGWTRVLTPPHCSTNPRTAYYTHYEEKIITHTHYYLTVSSAPETPNRYMYSLTFHSASTLGQTHLEPGTRELGAQALLSRAASHTLVPTRPRHPGTHGHLWQLNHKHFLPDHSEATDLNLQGKDQQLNI